MKYLINKLAQFKQWILSIVMCRFRLYNGKGAYPYNWGIRKNIAAYTDGFDKIIHINLGYWKIECVFER